MHHPRGFACFHRAAGTIRIYRVESGRERRHTQFGPATLKINSRATARARIRRSRRSLSSPPPVSTRILRASRIGDQSCTRPRRDHAGRHKVISRLAQELWLLPRNGAIMFMLLYRKFISPLYGEVCRYYPSCSRYALEVFQRQGFVIGVLLTIWRLVRCNPFTPGGIDDAPERKHSSFSVNTRGYVRPLV